MNMRIWLKEIMNVAKWLLLISFFFLRRSTLSGFPSIIVSPILHICNWFVTRTKPLSKLLETLNWLFSRKKVLSSIKRLRRLM